MRFPKIQFRLPEWVEEFLSGPDQVYRTMEERMHLVLELSRLNVEYKTGGPFGAAIFDQETKQLLSPGINLVLHGNCSILHAEIVAITIAQRIVQNYDLGGEGMPSYELVCNTEPCTMCIGAITWSGIRKLVCGARSEDVSRIGFDEGPKAPDWIPSFEKRGIPVVRDICRNEAIAIIRHYFESGGIIYNGRQGEGMGNASISND